MGTYQLLHCWCQPSDRALPVAEPGFGIGDPPAHDLRIIVRQPSHDASGLKHSPVFPCSALPSFTFPIPGRSAVLPTLIHQLTDLLVPCLTDSRVDQAPLAFDSGTADICTSGVDPKGQRLANFRRLVFQLYSKRDMCGDACLAAV